MINFNLLPPEIKEELKWEKINRSFTIHSLIIIAMIVVFILLLLIIQLYSVMKLTDLERTIGLKKENIKVKEVKNLEDEIGSFNENLIILDKIQKNHLYFSQVISIFAENVPESIQVIRLNIIQPEKDKKNKEEGKKNYQVNISGKAAKRDNLLIFKNALEGTSCFIKIYSPLSNLIKREDIDFRFTGDLNQEFLFKK